MADQSAHTDEAGAPDEPLDIGGLPLTSRAQQFKDILGGLGQLVGVQGGLIVTPDGFVITADLPPRISAEALAALAATLGRELELGTAELARGTFRTAFFSTDDGAVFLGGSPIGFLILLGDSTAEPAVITPALRAALSRLESAWKA